MDGDCFDGSAPSRNDMTANCPVPITSSVKGTGLFYICLTLRLRSARREKSGGNRQRSLPQHARRIHRRAVFWLKSLQESNRAQRKPTLSLALGGSFLFRLAERALLSLLFHEPPRSTLPGVPIANAHRHVLPKDLTGFRRTLVNQHKSDSQNPNRLATG
jgi:hypothetical protein